MYGQDFIANDGCSNVPSFFVVFQQRLVSASFYHWRDSHDSFQMHCVFLFCVFAELVISKMLFCSECFVTQWARNIFFNVDIPVILSECFLGLELFATHITNKITNHYCEFWFLQLLWSYSDECLSQTDSKAVSWNFHFYDDQSNPLNARLLIEIVFFFGISEVWKGS